MTDKQRAQTAARQQRFRERQALTRSGEQTAKGLPSLPAIASLPGHARWRAMISQAQMLLNTASEEMQSYSEDHSDAWQESIAAEDLLAKVELLQEAVAQLQTIA
jgi:hypothetical protein